MEYLKFREQWTPDDILSRLHQYRLTGVRVFNPAYIVTTCGVKMDKLDYVVRVASDVQKLSLPQSSSLNWAFKTISSVDGLKGSGFLAAQIIADLKYTPRLSEAVDWETWCSPGPGSMRGLNRLTGTVLTKRWDPGQFRQAITDLRKIVFQEVMSMDAQDMQNCLCEYDKYVRAKEGGRPKQNYGH
jgi:hypothetical protein